ncbi:MAG: YbjN domain-containing protein [Bacteroidetes bacterium]|nr:YbjN domain-containing protein [Bacteroidota bacterium]
MDLTQYYELVESCIRELGVDPVTCRNEPGKWTLKKGSATVWIDLWHIERENRPYYQVMSPVMRIPKDIKLKNLLFEELLAINDKLFGVAFTIYQGWVYLKVIREVDGMDQNEAMAMLHRVGNYADQYDDDLISKYGDDTPPPVNEGGVPPGGGGGKSDV